MVTGGNAKMTTMENDRQEYHKQYYITNREKEKARGQKRRAEHRERETAYRAKWCDDIRQPVIEWMRRIKSETICADCHLQYDPDQMQWDHLPGFEKLGEVSLFVYSGRQREAEEEMLKCDLICISCHTKRGWKRGQLRSRPGFEHE
jgi:hypothetical protein